MNVDCDWLRVSTVRVRFVEVALLLAACCLSLSGSRLRQTAGTGAQKSVDGFSSALADRASASLVPSRLASRTQARALFDGLPLRFEPNLGQASGQTGLDLSDPRVKFVARGSGYSLLLGSQGATLNLNRRGSGKDRATGESLQMTLTGANPNAPITAADQLPGTSNYLIGNDPAKWRSGIPQFARVRYEDVYPGINLLFYGNQGRLEYDFQLSPGANPAQPELEFDGAKQLALKDGALVIKGKGGSVRLEAPRLYQEIAGRRQPVEGRFILRGAHRVGFSVGAYDHSRELVIDPLLSFATYFGGVNDELNTSVAIDTGLNIYLTGSTNSPNLAVNASGTTAYQATLSGVRNTYIAKIQPPQGTNPAVLLYVTYLGGNGTDTPAGIAVDGANNAYVAGTTSSTNFPVTTTAYQRVPTAGPGPHVFVTKMNNTGSGLLYSSYLSGSGTDVTSGMTIDGQGYLYVTGTTTSTNPQDYAPTVEWPAISLPYGQPFQATPKAAAGVAQFFVTKVNTSSGQNASIAYSTYFGGGAYGTTTPVVTGGGIVVDSNGNIYFSGTTNFLYVGMNGTQFTDFPILNAYQPCLDTAPPSVIVNPPSCSNTSSTTLPDGFVAKLNPNAPAGTGQLGWSTFVGGSQTDSSTGVAIDSGAAHVYITGTTNSPDIGISTTTVTTTSAFQRCLDTPMNPTLGTACPTKTAPAPTDAFVAQLTNPAANCTTNCNMALSYFSFLGGSKDEQGLAIAVDVSNGALLTGWTQSPDFLVSGGADIQGTFTGTQDAFIARLNTAATSLSTSGSWTTLYGGSAATEGTSITIDANQNAYVAGDTTSPDLQIVKQVESYQGSSDAFVAQIGTASSLTIGGSVSLGTNQTYVSAGTPVTFSYLITNLGPDPANNFSVMDFLNTVTGTPAVQFQSASAPGGTCTQAASTATIVGCTIPTLQAGSTVTVQIVIVPAPTATGGSTSFTGGTVSVISANNIALTSTSVTALMSDFSMSVSPAGASVAAGNTAPFQVMLTPIPAYSSSISLSCSGLPQGAACNFTSTSVTLTGSSSGTTLNITTTARPITTAAATLTMHLYALWLCVPGVALFGLGSGGRRRRRVAGILLLCGVFSLLVVLPACSHSTVQPPVSGTPAGQYTIGVTATSGSDTKTKTLVLNVS